MIWITGNRFWVTGWVVLILVHALDSVTSLNMAQTVGQLLGVALLVKLIHWMATRKHKKEEETKQ